MLPDNFMVLATYGHTQDDAGEYQEEDEGAEGESEGRVPGHRYSAVLTCDKKIVVVKTLFDHANLICNRLL